MHAFVLLFVALLRLHMGQRIAWKPFCFCSSRRQSCAAKQTKREDRTNRCSIQTIHGMHGSRS